MIHVSLPPGSQRNEGLAQNAVLKRAVRCDIYTPGHQYVTSRVEFPLAIHRSGGGKVPGTRY